jgi:integrase
MNFVYKGKQLRRSTETANKKLAEKIYAKTLAQVAEGKWFQKPQGENITFREMMQRYESEKFSEMASSGKRGCKSYLNGLVEFFGDYNITEITPRIINQFKLQRKAQGRKPATINRQLTIMSSAYNVAIREWEWLDNNPLKRVSSEKVNDARDRWLTYDEEAMLIAACPSWLREIVLFALNTGMRQGEILSLTFKGVDLSRRTVTVFKSKNGDRRTIPVNKNVMELLKTKAKVWSLKTDLVFYTISHTPYLPSNLRRGFNKAVKNAGLEDLRFHDLRHTFATRLVQAGIDLYKVGKLLGHRDIRMTQRYSHHCPESLRDGVEILDGSGKNVSQFYHNQQKRS